MSLKNTTKKIVTHSALAICLLSPVSTTAGDPLQEIFGMMTTSAGPKAYESQKRNGVAFGTFSARFSMYQPKIIKFEPPSLSVGCGGIDFFAGSISLVKKEELVQMGRAIAAGAAVYAFNLAVEAICPTCSQAMQAIQDKLERFNELVSADCQNIVDGLSKMQVGKGAADSLRGAVNVGGWQESLGNFAETKTDSHGTWMDMLADRSPGGDPKNADSSGILGNVIWNALDESGLDNWTFAAGWTKEDMKMLLMSLTGTQIVGEDSDGKLKWQTIHKTVDVQELVYSDSGTKIKILSCKNTDDCEDFHNTQGTEKNWEGLYHQIYNVIMGTPGNDGIARKIAYKKELIAKEQSLVNNAPVNLMDMLFHLSRDTEAQKAVAEVLADTMAIQAVDQMVEQLYKMLKLARDSAQNSMDNNKSNIDYIQQRIIELENQRSDLLETHDSRMELPNKIIKKYESMVQAAKRMTNYGG